MIQSQHFRVAAITFFLIMLCQPKDASAGVWQDAARHGTSYVLRDFGRYCTDTGAQAQECRRWMDLKLKSPECQFAQRHRGGGYDLLLSMASTGGNDFAELLHSDTFPSTKDEWLDWGQVAFVKNSWYWIFLLSLSILWMLILCLWSPIFCSKRYRKIYSCCKSCCVPKQRLNLIQEQAKWKTCGLFWTWAIVLFALFGVMIICAVKYSTYTLHSVRVSDCSAWSSSRTLLYENAPPNSPSTWPGLVNLGDRLHMAASDVRDLEKHVATWQVEAKRSLAGGNNLTDEVKEFQQLCAATELALAQPMTFGTFFEDRAPIIESSSGHFCAACRVAAAAPTVSADSRFNASDELISTAAETQIRLLGRTATEIDLVGTATDDIVSTLNEPIAKSLDILAVAKTKWEQVGSSRAFFVLRVAAVVSFVIWGIVAAFSVSLAVQWRNQSEPYYRTIKRRSCCTWFCFSILGCFCLFISSIVFWAMNPAGEVCQVVRQDLLTHNMYSSYNVFQDDVKTNNRTTEACATYGGNGDVFKALAEDRDTPELNWLSDPSAFQRDFEKRAAEINQEVTQSVDDLTVPFEMLTEEGPWRFPLAYDGSHALPQFRLTALREALFGSLELEDVPGNNRNPLNVSPIFGRKSLAQRLTSLATENGCATTVCLDAPGRQSCCRDVRSPTTCIAVKGDKSVLIPSGNLIDLKDSNPQFMPLLECLRRGSEALPVRWMNSLAILAIRQQLVNGQPPAYAEHRFKTSSTGTTSVPYDQYQAYVSNELQSLLNQSALAKSNAGGILTSTDTYSSAVKTVVKETSASMDCRVPFDAVGYSTTVVCKDFFATAALVALFLSIIALCCLIGMVLSWLIYRYAEDKLIVLDDVIVNTETPDVLPLADDREQQIDIEKNFFTGEYQDTVERQDDAFQHQNAVERQDAV